MLPGTVLSWIGGGISDPGESNAVQNVRSQMVTSPQSGVFNPLRRRKKEESLKGPASKKADNVNSKGNQTLLPHHQELQAMGVSLLRLSPQLHDMPEIIRLHRDVLDGKATWADVQPELTRLAVGTPVDGYWRGLPGIEALKEESHALA